MATSLEGESPGTRPLAAVRRGDDGHGYKCTYTPLLWGPYPTPAGGRGGVGEAGGAILVSIYLGHLLGNSNVVW